MSSQAYQTQNPQDEQRPGTALKNKRIQAQNNQQLPDLSDKRAQSAGGANQRQLTFQNKQIKPIYQELGFIAPTSAKSATTQVGGKGMQSIHSGILNNPKNNSQQEQTNELLQKDYKRIIPKNIMHDSEKLYEELLRSKSLANFLQNDNYKLRTRIAFQEEEINKNTNTNSQDPTDNILSSSSNAGNGLNRTMSVTSAKFANPGQQSVSEQSLVPNLKKQVRDLNEELKLREKELQSIKRNVKLTKLSELEVELKGYADETIRLKHMLQQALKVQESNETGENMEEMYVQQVNQNQSLQKDIEGLMQEISTEKSQNSESQQRIREQERQIYKLTKDKTELKKTLVRKEKDLDRYRQQDPINNGPSRQRNIMGTSEGQLKTELEKKILENNEINTELISLKKDYEELKKKTDLKCYEYEEQIKIQKEIQTDQEIRIEKNAKELADQIDKYNKVIGTNNRNQQRQKKENSLHRNSLSQNQMQNSNQNDGKVILQDIQNLVGYELKYRLLSKKIDPLTLGQHLFSSEALSSNNISYRDLQRTLSKDPFSIVTETKLNPVLKYLMCEPGDTSFGESSQQTTQFVKKNFLDIVMNYKKMKRDEEKQIIKNVFHTINNNQDPIKSKIQEIQMANFGSSDSQICTRETFFKSLQSVGADMSMIDYIMKKLYEETRNVDSINITTFFEVFDLSNSPEHNASKRDSFIQPIPSHRESASLVRPQEKSFTRNNNHNYTESPSQSSRFGKGSPPKKSSEKTPNSRHFEKFDTKETPKNNNNPTNQSSFNKQSNDSPKVQENYNNNQQQQQSKQQAGKTVHGGNLEDYQSDPDENPQQQKQNEEDQKQKELQKQKYEEQQERIKKEQLERFKQQEEEKKKENDRIVQEALKKKQQEQEYEKENERLRQEQIQKQKEQEEQKQREQQEQEKQKQKQQNEIEFNDDFKNQLNSKSSQPDQSKNTNSEYNHLDDLDMKVTESKGLQQEDRDKLIQNEKQQEQQNKQNNNNNFNKTSNNNKNDDDNNYIEEDFEAEDNDYQLEQNITQNQPHKEQNKTSASNEIDDEVQEEPEEVEF